MIIFLIYVGRFENTVVLTGGYRTIEEKLRKQISVEGKCDTAYVILCYLSVGGWLYHKEASCVL